MSSEMSRGGSGQRVAPVSWRVVSRGGAGVLDQISLAQQLEQKFLEGKQKGAAEAQSTARREADAQVQAVLQRLAQSIEVLAEARQKLREETAADLVRLSTAIASRILHREITLDPDAVHGLLRAAFDKVQAREITRIFVHPAHQEAVRRFVEQSAVLSKIEIVVDPDLKGGDIRIETPQGQLDASVDTQLKEIERGLADQLN
ncbi:MAG: FliH/SctL family protein [Bryobacteraceae bacterium]|jgi:flagellar assembly protein FliH